MSWIYSSVDDPFAIVKDSALWRNSESYGATTYKDPFIRLGIIKKVVKDDSTKRLKHLVEINNRGVLVEIICDLALRSGGAFNYEESIHRGYLIEDKPDAVNSYSSKAGDMVIVACLNGEYSRGIILGFVAHLSRAPKLDYKKGPQYISEFNGLETHINETGEYKLTFKSIQKNIKKLSEKPSKELPKPEYDEEIGGSFLMFDKTGSFKVTDSSKENTQSLFIDKKNGKIDITSGKIKVTLTKKDEKISIKSKILDINSETSIKHTTKDLAVDASKSIKLKSPKVAIGADGTELLEQLSKLIDAIGSLVIISPVSGPCNPIQAAPTWSQVTSIQSKIKQITGSL
jgi:hypothetical protein